jgi:DNA-binding response OmpR family regulator
MGLSSPAGSRVILLADSDTFARNLLSRELSREGYYVLAASNCEEALRLAHNFEETIHLLLANSDIPGREDCTDGVVRDRPDVRVLLISATTHEDLIRRSREQARWSGTILPEQVRNRIRRAFTDPAVSSAGEV